ncbi:MAG: hypothetical protein GY849_04795 [Deltaproteobacteria bacterium]|nr:hypothetical protein [Deltaproteobacteria bacterium]
MLKKKDAEKLGQLLSICHRCKQNDYAETLYRTAHWPKRGIRGRPGAEKTAAVS